MTQNVRLQNLRDFTVQILHTETEATIGTGIAVSMDGRILTCAHVVRDAGVDPRLEQGKEVGVYFQFLRGGEQKKRCAVVEKFFSESDDDIVQLKLTDGPAPLAPEQMPKLGSAKESAGHGFRSFGYRKLSAYQGLPADGHIVDYGSKPGDRAFLLEPLVLSSQHIDSGMSGAAVLDVERNLVVGLVYETYDSAGWQKDRDTAFAVDSQVLKFKPFDFHLEDDPYPKREAPSPKTDIAQAEAAVFIKEKYSWNSAPTVLTEWTGRDDLLTQITEDWNNPQKHVTGLIGFGGEGKSSLARKWVDDLCRGGALLRPYERPNGDGAPDGVFWWGFYENRSIDEFLEAALNYLSGGKIDPRQVPSSSLRAQIIGAMLGAGRYLFVLDGLEVLQHQEGDQYGLLQSNDLRDLLTYFARPDNQSFCLITSRAPVLDLMEYTTYTHRDVDRLSQADGVLLLEKLGVKGSKEQMGKVVSDWDGHALTISLLGSYLAEKYNGDIAHLADIPIPTADEPRYERVHRVLRRYDEHLTETEREFLKLFSAFRTPVHESAFEKVFVPLLHLTTENTERTEKKKKGFIARLFNSESPDSPITNYQSPITNIVSRLVTYRILHCDTTSQTYTAHPLVRNHYLAILTRGDSTEQHDVHGKIKDYYLSIAGDTPQFPTLDDLKPLIEVVHHACQAGAYDEAHNIRGDRIDQGSKFILTHQLGAYETELQLMLEFFSDGDVSKEPKLTSSSSKRFILSHIAFCLMGLGRIREAVPFYERVAKANTADEDWENSGVSYRNLADLHAQLGALEASAEAARQALDFVRRVENKDREVISLSYQGQVLSLQGNLKEAEETFEKAQTLEKEDDPTVQYLTRVAGVRFSKHLEKMGNLEYCRLITKANLNYCEKSHWFFIVSMCHHVLGDLDFDSNKHESARAYYESALKIARSIQDRDVLIEALLARGRFYAKVAAQTSEVFKTSEVSVEQSFTDLNEALNYAVEGGYRIYEADIRVALAWAYLANGEKEKAKQSAQRALQMSREMGYHWGRVDGEEVLERMKDE